ncbi:ABC transporter substrate-binding protein [Rothia nasimurium]|uniref:ABC transporter substrate-binding protein n=1 Tax=Rothia nasimurium TaxID=85336 RepID=UPI001F30F2F3|nr:ABC transporter substrate-binding protein [Rothia nasimurium]
MAASALSRRTLLHYGSILTAGLALSACSSPTEADPAASASATESAGPTFRFAQGAQVLTLDPAATYRVESHRISAQILEPLVRSDVNTGEPAPSLATSWETSEDGLTYTFNLVENATFSDGTPLTASSILANIERWSTLGKTALTRMTQPFHQLFGSAKAADGNEIKPLVTAWSAPTDTSLDIVLSRPSRSFLKALTQPAFGLILPSSIGVDGYLTSTPIGTGAFMLSSWDGNTAVLTRNTAYRGEIPDLAAIEFLTIPDAEKRYYNLLEGSIDAYDQVALKDYVPLALDGYPVQSRDPYAITYLGINLSHPAFDDARVRQALARSIDRAAIVEAYYPQGTNTAPDFIPALFQMKNEDMEQVYTHNLSRARELLRASTYANQAIDFYYPVNLSLPSLPSPEGIYSLISANLVEAGFNIVPKPYRWSDADTEDVPTAHPDYGLELTGFIGAFRDPTAFLGHVLTPAASAPTTISEASPSPTPTPSPTSTAAAAEPAKASASYASILQAINEADTYTDITDWRNAYKEINNQVANLLSAIPLVYPVSGVTQGQRVRTYTVSATCIDDFSTVHIDD